MQIARLEMPLVLSFSFFSLEGYNIQTTTFVLLTFAKQLNEPRREEKVGKYFEKGFQMIIGVTLERMQMEIRRNVRETCKRRRDGGEGSSISL